ncbi:MAG: DUF2905 domain-containing protein [bacterium]
MDDFSSTGRVLIIIGFFIIIIGVFILFSDKIPYLGMLPGDIYIEKKNFRFYFPLATSVIISIILSIIIRLFSKK